MKQFMNTARVVTSLTSNRDWDKLLSGEADAIRLQGFASSEECSQLVGFVVRDSRQTGYATAAGITRLGTSFNDARKSEKIAEEYTKRDIVQDALDVNTVVSRLFGLIAASWPWGLETFSYQGIPLHRSIARRIIGGGAEPHDDNIAKELPINLPAEHRAEALVLRNKLLLFRFRNLKKRPAVAPFVDRTLEPRLNQIFLPLLSIIEDATAREKIRAVARQYQREIVSDRGLGTEAQVLEVIQDLIVLDGERPLSIRDITARFAEVYGHEYQKKITAKWIGFYVNKRLRLKGSRTRDGYVIPLSEKPRLDQLFEKYGLSDATQTQANPAKAPDSTFTSSPRPETPPG